jgi:hypothetical protein
MNRSDYEMVNRYEEMTRKAPEHHSVVDFHGTYKPGGLHPRSIEIRISRHVLSMGEADGKPRLNGLRKGCPVHAFGYLGANRRFGGVPAKTDVANRAFGTWKGSVTPVYLAQIGEGVLV